MVVVVYGQDEGQLRELAESSTAGRFRFVGQGWAPEMGMPRYRPALLFSADAPPFPAYVTCAVPLDEALDELGRWGVAIA